MHHHQPPPVNRPWVRDVITLTCPVAGLCLLIAVACGGFHEVPHIAYAGVPLMLVPVAMCSRRMGDVFWGRAKFSTDGAEIEHSQSTPTLGAGSPARARTRLAAPQRPRKGG